jgi:hypothetical protein
VISSRRNLASFALRRPKWPAVALFFWVRAICEGNHFLSEAATSFNNLIVEMEICRVGNLEKRQIETFGT